MVTETAERNKQTVRRLFEDYFNQGKSELLPELMAAEYVGELGDKGPAAFSAVVDGLRRGFPNIRYHLEDLVAEGDRVVARWTWSGTHAGPFRGFPPTGKAITNAGIAIFQLRDGKIIRSWTQTDRLGFLQEIGAVPADLGARPR